jgi:transposase
MLCPEYYRVNLCEFDRQVFQQFVSAKHPLRKMLAEIDWDAFYPLLAPYYSADEGQPAINPVLMLKLEYLKFRSNLSDCQVVARAETDMGFRWFLQLSSKQPLPHPSSLCIFRGRLGQQGFRQVFDKLVGMAREQGFVKDRLRIKDATHVIANVAVPSTLALVAQIRDKLLESAASFDSVRVEGERVNIALLRERTESLGNEEKLLARVTHLREMLAWLDELAPPADAERNRGWRKFLELRATAHKILADQEKPGEGHRTFSVVDPDARQGKHGDWFKGYLVDILVDANSEIITQLNVLPAGGEEAADAVELLCREEQAHGNDVESLSIDGAGFRGPVLRELEDPQGLNVNTYVPAPPEPESKIFKPQDFQQDAEKGTLTCPAGETTSSRHRNTEDTGWIYNFKHSACASCPLLSRCMTEPPKGRLGKTVRKNDYDEEYRRARAKTQTPAYAQVRSEHPMVERKLGELMNRHGGRRTWFHGRAKVLIHQLMVGLVTNAKRLVRLLCARAEALAQA